MSYGMGTEMAGNKFFYLFSFFIQSKNLSSCDEPAIARQESDLPVSFRPPLNRGRNAQVNNCNVKRNIQNKEPNGRNQYIVYVARFIDRSITHAVQIQLLYSNYGTSHITFSVCIMGPCEIPYFDFKQFGHFHSLPTEKYLTRIFN